MERDAIAHLFTLLASFLFIYAVSAWSLSQGGAAIEEVPGLDGRAPAVSAYFAVLVISFVLTVLAALGIGYARSAEAGDLRVPPVGLGGYNLAPGSLAVRIYLGFVVTAFVLVPAFSLVHLNGKLADGWIWNEQSPGGAAVPVSCAMPAFWTFGRCDGTYATAAPALLVLQGVMNDGRSEPGRLWLASHNCDPVRERSASGPQVAARIEKKGPLLTEDERTARTRIAGLPEPSRGAIYAFELMSDAPADEPPALEYCEKPREASQFCREVPDDCRGITWLATGSPSLIIAMSMLAWATVLLLLAVLAVALWSDVRSGTAVPPSPPLDAGDPAE